MSSSVGIERGTPGYLHGLELDLSAVGAWWMEPDAPALVLGSAQSSTTVQVEVAAARGIEVVRRRSGGGGVLVVPGELLWLDVVVPRGSRHWDDDVGRAMWWLGERWVAALAAVGVEGALHRGPFRRSPWSGSICFAGLGAGEVVAPDGSKLVGVSQRRTRAGARLQSMCHLRWQPDLMAALVVDPPPRADLATMVAAVDVPAERLRAAVAAALLG